MTTFGPFISQPFVNTGQFSMIFQPRRPAHSRARTAAQRAVSATLPARARQFPRAPDALPKHSSHVLGVFVLLLPHVHQEDIFCSYLTGRKISAKTTKEQL
ncbi:hypothetical protein [Streptomyces chattanoogensis]|uniref:hypothetical protein n=1 Tax=Streptomyces chattanoogensis TaxID=66876 RepID=UPI0036CD075A